MLFSGPMVKALQAGTKTQTRRALKCQHDLVQRVGANLFEASDAGQPGYHLRCPYGFVGDRIWVCEGWMDLEGTGIEHSDPITRKRQRYAYRADSPPGSASDEARKDYGLKWRPSIHMPRAACRLELEITDVRVEKLHRISEADAIAEGVTQVAGQRATVGFAWLWVDINGSASWARNPWVWVVKLRKVP